RDAAEDAFALRECARGLDRFLVGDGDDAIRDLAIQYAGNEVRGPALDLVRREFGAPEQRGGRGLAGDDTGAGPRELDDLASASERAAGAPARDEEVEPSAREIAVDHGTRGLALIGGVR